MVLAKINTELSCGIDLHARTMYVTVMDKWGNILFRKNKMPNNFNTFLHYMEPFLGKMAVGVESTYNWYWLGDGCHQHGIPFYLGHALYMKAISGDKNKTDKLNSKTIADLMRTNFFPLAYAYPREMRPTRDLLRRRNYFVALRAAANAHAQTIFSQEAIFDICGKDLKKKDSRHLLADKLDDVDLALSFDCDMDFMDAMDPIVAKLEKQILAQAKHHNRKDFAMLQTTPGIGDILALALIYEIHRIERFGSPQQFSSYARVVKCQRTSNGKVTGGGNQKIGNPNLKWAFSEIVIRSRCHSSLIKQQFERLLAKHGPRKAHAIMRHKFAVAIYYMLKNGQAFDEARFVANDLK